MTTLESPARPLSTSNGSGVEPIYDATLLPNRRKWTRAQYALLDDGGERYELINGELIKKTGMRGPHQVTIMLAQGALLRVFSAGFCVRIQLPMMVSDNSEPEPDLAVVEGEARDHQASPQSALLVVEVSDATLATDLGVKVALYAQAQVPEYWVVDINARLLHVHRTPIAAPALPNGYGYQTVSLLTETDDVSPLAAPQNSIRVADLLP